MVRRKRTWVEYFGSRIGRFSSLISDRAFPRNKEDANIQFMLKKEHDLDLIFGYSDSRADYSGGYPVVTGAHSWIKVELVPRFLLL
jgi:hypothetical protein